MCVLALLFTSTGHEPYHYTHLCVPAALHHRRSALVVHALPRINMQPESSTRAAYTPRPPHWHAPENRGPPQAHAPEHSQRCETHSRLKSVYNKYSAWLKSCGGSQTVPAARVPPQGMWPPRIFHARSRPPSALRLRRGRGAYNLLRCGYSQGQTRHPVLRGCAPYFLAHQLDLRCRELGDAGEQLAPASPADNCLAATQALCTHFFSPCASGDRLKVSHFIKCGAVSAARGRRLQKACTPA